MGRKSRAPELRFNGELSGEGLQITTRFRVRIGSDGEFRLTLPELPLTRVTADLLRLNAERRQSLPFLKLTGSAQTGKTFESEFIVLTGAGHHDTPTTSRVTFRLACSKGTIRYPLTERMPGPVLRWNLRGFEAFPAIEVKCSLGRVVMAGEYPKPTAERVSGYLQIQAEDEPEDLTAWRSNAERLCDHLLRYMSFALSHPIQAPLQDFWSGTVLERTAVSEGRPARFGQAVIHPMLLQPFFERVVASFFDPPIQVVYPTHGLQWFAMDASHTETRLTHAVTALENLVDANLDEADQFFLPPNQFNKVARKMRQAARDAVAELPPPKVTEADTQELSTRAVFLDSLPAKMLDLNRRPFAEKLRRLAALWGVPLNDLLVGDGLDRAIRARNAIVHRGWYYPPETSAPATRDLWDHVLLMREIVVRFVLTTIGYEGNYLSFRGGQHDVAFPPVQLEPPSEPSSLG